MKLTFSRRRSLLAALLLPAAVVATAGSGHAAVIAFGAPTNISGDSNVSTMGTLVGAFNFAGATTSVNGVNFLAFPVGAASNTVGNFTLSVPSGTIAAVNTSFPAPPFSNLSAGYQALLGTAAGSGQQMTLTMNGLTVGQNYLFETWVNDSRDFTSAFTFPVTVSAGNSVILIPNTTVFGGGVGQFVLGTFTANSTSQQVGYFNSEFAIVNGFQLRALAPPSVPEPGTALAGALLVGLCGTLRRRG